jgi:hypothetical protein
MLRKAIYATPVVILTMGAAFAQDKPPPTIGMPGYSPMRTEQERKSDRAIDRAYESTIKGRPDAVKQVDPWGDVRATPPAAAAKNKQQ